MSSPRPCRSLGCSELTRTGFCDKHSQAEQRKSSRERGYSAAWDRTSKLYRQEQPLCEQCKADGKTTAAAVVDHIVPLHVAPQLKHVHKNLQSLCLPHHATKTNSDKAKYGSASTHSVASLR